MNWKNNHIKFEEIPAGEYINFDWKEDDIASIDFSNCKYLIVWHHQSKEKDFSNLPDIPNLLYLEVNWSRSTSLNGLSKFKELKRLELHYCTKLETLDGIESLNKEIEHIHISQSKKLTSHERITLLNQLRVLCFNECGVIDNLKFLKELPQLKDFRFVNSNVLDGDLSPILQHPKLENAGFLNKRHYSHKDTFVEDYLKRRKITNAQSSSPP
ncbi:hypothetical protein [Pontibacter sp. SGAir0037]|uniref:hypothetical protein n=1 Tax=Pontibacter sp. SGAir0037 TaxID=2571030 RepID=UPI0010CD36A2|nr:hypothetical protein [Pontibacter sp. SGAir0037]QCR21643.1 hypothetical protein C1N53_04310 [Pontibacter sp. SGAir0037]